MKLKKLLSVIKSKILQKNKLPVYVYWIIGGFLVISVLVFALLIQSPAPSEATSQADSPTSNHSDNSKNLEEIYLSRAC